LITDASKLYLQPQEWYDDGAIDFQSDDVVSVDFKEKSVKTKSGKSYPYTKLILATGGTPNNLPLPGFKDLSNIYLLRQLSDVQGIMNAVGDKGKKIVIIGTSFIGMEVANALAKENDVTLVGMEDAPLERVMGKQVGQLFQKALEKNGAKFYMGASVESAVPTSKIASAVGAGSVGGVKLKDGTELEADLVIMGVGVKPATQYLKDNSEVKLEKDGSLTVDELFAVKGLSDVYAIGDIATYPYSGPGGNKTPVRIEHWNVAQNMGRSVGQQIAQPGSKPKPFIPIFWSALGSQLRYCGSTPNGWDDLILKGELDQGKFAAYYTKGDDVVAVASMQMDPIMVTCAELMRRGEMLSKSDINGGRDPLQASL
jgi:NADPH-dependent 2,4-dienoyl-CoA reductase/sulfur reductase-like enzyme